MLMLFAYLRSMGLRATMKTIQYLSVVNANPLARHEIAVCLLNNLKCMDRLYLLRLSLVHLVYRKHLSNSL